MSTSGCWVAKRYIGSYFIEDLGGDSFGLWRHLKTQKTKKQKGNDSVVQCSQSRPLCVAPAAFEGT
jgi:hypothetical protein